MLWDSLHYGNATEVMDIGSVRNDRQGNMSHRGCTLPRNSWDTIRFY